MKIAQCIGGPLDGENLPLYDFVKMYELFVLRAGEWPSNPSKGQYQYQYVGNNRLKYVGQYS